MRNSVITKSVVTTAPPARSERVTVDVHPQSGACMNPRTRAVRPGMRRDSPRKSKGLRLPDCASSFVFARMRMRVMMMMAGILIQKIHRHDSVSVKKPPTRGPRAMKVPPQAVWMPNARPRCSGGKTWLMRAIPFGKMIAAPRPWTARAVMRVAGELARPQAREATPKMATPMQIKRRMLKMSPSLPPTAERQVKTRR